MEAYGISVARTILLVRAIFLPFGEWEGYAPVAVHGWPCGGACGSWDVYRPGASIRRKAYRPYSMPFNAKRRYRLAVTPEGHEGRR